ncbi:siderophore-interacting protein [Corynebacterium uberis]|uniref:siderophore-interacting protein n=1 Tax=Corynebacterium TaxID=1716 RepID=UPI001D0B49F8|nr:MULTISPECIES: siderophore-interacting protein [Corynebacterium]MCZ9309081.1 siderophore-interacting protein [Corynebacterium sp. c6VSa_13]UDL74454.1 siderophore-interacting protein [Corynebacterium uberis]UDL76711.1 siderophore-interacting protein [Corynebacterium uberis]UDL78924.1 siderophore-interacting protein [Corynebacterium uberis]UDL81202.1 siderophore-interacting protein [Corynebacterium uberis]
MPHDPEMVKRKRRALGATVTATRWISSNLIRVSFSCPGIVGMDLPFTDHYIKFLFIPEGADYSWPFELAEIRETRPADMQPVRRTYTLRSWDTQAGTFDVDFVAHGEEGLAGPWAQRAQPGDVLAFAGPGGAWAPRAEYAHFVLAGDEAAAPAVAAGVDKLPAGATAQVYLEVADASARFELDVPEGVTVQWVHRDGATPGAALAHAVRAGGIPEAHTSWFIHGVAEMIKDLRRFLFVENSVDKKDVSITGYWRLGMIEDQWQASKHDFNRELEEAEGHSA